MAEPHKDSASQAASIDLSQFYQVFFEQVGENLALMERTLPALDRDAANDETPNAIFRCAQSVKGGAATFGFARYITGIGSVAERMLILLDIEALMGSQEMGLMDECLHD